MMVWTDAILRYPEKALIARRRNALIRGGVVIPPNAQKMPAESSTRSGFSLTREISREASRPCSGHP
jgi:hypothetical protein